MLKLNIKRLLSGLLLPLLTAAMCGLLCMRESDFLREAAEHNLWMDTPTYLQTMLKYPGGLLSWAACFGIQFFRYPALACLLLWMMWTAIAWLASFLFQLKDGWRLLSLLLPLALLAAMTQTGYWLYYQKFPGHLLVPTLGVLSASIAAAVHRFLPNRWGMSIVWMTVWSLLGYAACGMYGLLGTALMMWPQRWSKLAIAPALCGLVLMAFVPAILSQQCYAEVGRSMSYLAAMPTLSIGEVRFDEYRLPYYAMVLSVALCMVVSLLPERLLTLRNGYSIGLLMLMLGGVATEQHWYKDSNFHKELRMQSAIRDLEWDKAVKVSIERSEVPPTRLMILLRNIALFRLGRAGDEMFRYLQGDTKPAAPWPVRMTTVGAPMVYMQYGQVNYAYRWCMENAIEIGWTEDKVRTMAKISLLNGEVRLAKKYINMLAHTTFCKEEAKRLLHLADHPEAIADDAELAFIHHLIPKDNRLDGDHQQVEQYLQRALLNGKPEDPLLMELSLLMAMQTQDIPSFWPRFFAYTSQHQGKVIPLHYQEAAFLYGMLEGQVDVKRMPFDPAVPKRYNEFMHFNEQCGNMSQEQRCEAFRPMFGDTFFYFYFFVRNLHSN